MQGTVLLPSLARPHLLKKFFESYKNTEAEVPGLVLVDKTDPKKEEYLSLEYPENWRLVLTEGVTMGDKVREVWEQIKDLDFVMLCNDDHILHTKHWDQIMISQLNGFNVLGTNDGPTPDKPFRAPHKIGGMTAWSGNVIREVGYIFPEGLHHLYIDDVWEFLSGSAKCCQILMDVCVEHDHFLKHAGEPGYKMDKTYEKMNTQDNWKKETEVFQKYMAGQAQKDAEKLTLLQPKTGIMIATPTHDGQCSLEYAVGLSDLTCALRLHNIHFEFARVVGSSLIPHVRNSLADMFMRSKCQKLLFVDSDQGFQANNVFTLLNSSRRIIAGVTPHKRYPINLNFQPKKEHEKYFKELCNKGVEEFYTFAQACADAKGEVEVERSGTGFMMIDRSVFEIMREKVPKYFPFDEKHDESYMHSEYFKIGCGDDGLYRGEDWHFCEMAKSLQIPIYINVYANVIHHGSHVFGFPQFQPKPQAAQKKVEKTA